LREKDVERGKRHFHKRVRLKSFRAANSVEEKNSVGCKKSNRIVKGQPVGGVVPEMTKTRGRGDADERTNVNSDSGRKGQGPSCRGGNRETYPILNRRAESL